MKLSNLSRLAFIFHTVLYYRLFRSIPNHLRPWYIKLILIAFFWYPKIKQSSADANNIRHALESLGPVWIKLGQMLSTRKDLLSEEFSIELSKLQDQIAPFDGELAKHIICQALSIDDIHQQFETFEVIPLATASIAQVHTATLVIDQQPKDVVVKVIRPGITQQIEADISLMKLAAGFVKRYLKDGARLRPLEVIEEYEKTIHSELNLAQEAANGQQLKRNFENSADLYIPEIYSEHCRKNILVMERIYGIPVSDIERLKSQNTDLKLLAEKGVSVFFTQVFRDSFFHADMHPGNIFVAETSPDNPQYIGIDFGIMGTLNSGDKRYLAENFVAFFNRDYLKVAQLHVESGWVPSHVNVEQFEMAIRTVCEPIFNKPLDQISFAQVLIGLFDTARQFEMEVQPQLVLLQKTLLYVEGLGRQLYPQLDLWQTAKPFLEDWVNQQIGFKAAWKQIKSNAPYWIEKAPGLPDLVHSSLTSIKQLPVLQQQLISEYHRAQNGHKQFIKDLTLFSLSSLSLLLTALFAKFDNQLWYGLSGFLSVAMIYFGYRFFVKNR